MKYKWLGGLLGMALGGPLGALVGYLFGDQIDKGSKKIVQHTTPQNDNRNSFLFALLVLASYIIRADKRVMHSEMQLVRAFLRRNFGADAEREGEEILLRLFERQKEEERLGRNDFATTIRRCGLQIQQMFTHEQRLQLLDFLTQIAQADGHVHPLEINALYFCAQAIGMQTAEVDAMLHLKDDSLDAAYKILQIAPTATDKEVKAAFKRLALQHHPDRVATLGEDIKAAAEKRFCEINNAKERIYKARGIA